MYINCGSCFFFQNVIERSSDIIVSIVGFDDSIRKCKWIDFVSFIIYNFDLDFVSFGDYYLTHVLKCT